MRYVVDTHALLWFLTGNSRLGAQAREILADPESELILTATVLAEARWIVSRGRTPIPSVKGLLAALDSDRRFRFVKLDRAIIEKSTELTSVAEMHDREIVAAVLLLAESGEEVSLLTFDGNITAANLVPVVW